MSEQKRVSFTTISSSSTVSFSAPTAIVGSSGAPNAAASLRFGSDFLSSQDKPGSVNATGASNTERKVGGEINKTIRLKLELFQTDSCTYPEFNYSKLLHSEKKKLKKRKQKSNGFSADPFEENDDDVVRIAKELEQKYGSTYGSGRGRSKKDDHCDIGLGYDESDSFIDNTEAYDEVIPEEVETIEGGFYINCGALEFKKLHTEATKTKTDEIIKMPNRPRKRVLSSSSEDSSTTDEDDEDDDDNSDDDGDDSGDDESTTEGATKNKNIIAPPAEKRQKTSNSTKKPSSAQDTDVKKKSKTVAISCSSSNSPKPSSSHEIGSDSDKERVQLQKTIKTTTVKDMLKTKRDNFLKMQVGDSRSANGELKGAATKSYDESSSDDSDDSSDNSDSNHSVPQQEEKKTNKIKNNEESSEKLRSTDTKLPELDPEVVISIQQFKEVVKSKNMTGKKFQFDDNLTEVFLKIDEALLCIDKSQRNMVFAHLEYNLLLPKYYFLRKAKQLRIKEEKLKSKRALAKLRKAVIETMPDAIRNFELDLRKHADLQTGNLNSDHPPKMPKKKFIWTLDLRNLLYDVYQVRWTSYPVLRTRKETLEDFINVYMRDKVVELWPNGWMRYEDLQKEIERRKAATKKSKEKKKDTTNSSSAANPTSANAAPAAAVPSIQSSSTNTFIKQFEEFTTSSSRSCANSDTDSVASNSGTSNGIKRKNADNKNKNSKNKAQKAATLAVQQQTLAADLMSSLKRTDHSIHNIITPTMVTDSSTAIPSSGSNSNNGSSQHSKQHSKSGERDSRVPIIDLDNYKGTSAILQSTQQLLTSATQLSDNSSESDCVEIVGVFPAKSLPSTTSITTTTATTTKKNKRNFASSSGNRNMNPLTNNAFHNNMETNSNLAAVNNNNNYNNNNGKKSGGVGVGVNVTDFDVNEIVKVLKEESKGLQSTFTPQNASIKDAANQ